MHDAILRRMRDLVRRSRYVMTAHGRQEMQADDLGLFDVEHSILTGRIIERQRDRRTREWKYLVRGETLGGRFRHHGCQARRNRHVGHHHSLRGTTQRGVG